MAHSAHVELHGVRIQAHRDGPVLQQPLRHLRLVLGDLYAARNTRNHACPMITGSSFHSLGATTPIAPSFERCHR